MQQSLFKLERSQSLEGGCPHEAFKEEKTITLVFFKPLKSGSGSNSDISFINLSLIESTSRLFALLCNCFFKNQSTYFQTRVCFECHLIKREFIFPFFTSGNLRAIFTVSFYQRLSVNKGTNRQGLCKQQDSQC